MAEDVAEAMAEFDARPESAGRIDASSLVDEEIVEMEADFGDDGEAPPQTLAKIALKRVPTEVMKGVIEVPASKPHIEASLDKVEATLEMDADEPTPPPQPVPFEMRVAVPVAPVDAPTMETAPKTLETPAYVPPVEETAPTMETAPKTLEIPAYVPPVEPPLSPPSATVAVEPLLRADDALGDLGLKQLVVSSDFVLKDAPPARIPEALKRAEPAERARPAFDDRSRSRASSRANCRRPSAGFSRFAVDGHGRRDEYEDALGDIISTRSASTPSPACRRLGRHLDASFDHSAA